MGVTARQSKYTNLVYFLPLIEPLMLSLEPHSPDLTYSQ